MSEKRIPDNVSYRHGVKRAKAAVTKHFSYSTFIQENSWRDLTTDGMGFEIHVFSHIKDGFQGMVIGYPKTGEVHSYDILMQHVYRSTQISNGM